ncbi:MAG: MFS transporter, partial [Acidimicrobiia bacterium]|nr:MFS transporter [Acidimicrobiia bacterium]
WSVEQVANNFIGPPLGALLLVAAFSVPFFVDAATFAVAAALVALIRPLSTPEPRVVGERTSWVTELKEGFGWLWKHDLLRPMAIILGLLNMAGMISFAVFVLFAQEVLKVSPTVFAILGTGAAVGGIVGGWAAPYVSKRIGSGASLGLALMGGAVTSAVIGVTSWWPITWLMFAIFSGLAVLWNVITVSLRQTIIPDRLLGRVNSVYRFFAWGMMPIGAVAGGLIVAITETVASRDLALRTPWLVAAGLQVVLFAFARPRLTTEKIETARTEVG